MCRDAPWRVPTGAILLFPNFFLHEKLKMINFVFNNIFLQQFCAEVRVPRVAKGADTGA